MASTEAEPAPEITLREITKRTVRAICSLEVRSDQRQFVAPNATSIAEAYFEPKAWFRAVYAGEEPVGFVMLYEDPDGTGDFPIEYERPIYFVWRFMIDGNHQGRGYGKRAMELVIEHVRQQPGARALFLSVVPGEGSAEGLYRSLGFERTGRFEDREAEMRLALT
jgi:diamine N-acetyltransferase